MAKKVDRLYTMQDELMQTRAQVMHDNLAADLADFTPHFPFVTALYNASFQTDITTAKTFPLDGVVISNIKVLTADVEASKDEGGEALDDIDTYAKLAYKNDLARQRVFGQDDWSKAKNDQEKMVNALEHCHSFASVNPYKAALMGKGLLQLGIDRLLTIANDINVKNGLQENAKSARPVTTQDRIIVNNIVYARMQEIRICAQKVYRNDAAKLEQYNLYPSGNQTLTVVVVHVSKNNAAVETATVNLTNTALAEQVTDVNGNAPFQSVNMPDSVDVNVVHATHGTINLDNQTIVEGESNTIEVVYP